MLPIHFGAPRRRPEALFWSPLGEVKSLFGNLSFVDDVLNEITTFHPLRGLSREAKCDPCASLRHVPVLLHMQTPMGAHIGARMVILGVPGGSLEGPPLSLFCLLEALRVHV